MVIIPPDVALNCLQIVQQVKGAATVAVAATALLAGGFWLASTRETGGAIDETQTLADGTVVRLTGYGSDRIRTITATSPDGVVSVLEVEATGYGYTLIGGAVDGKPMTPDQLRSAARQASGGEVQVVYNSTPGKGQGSQTGAAGNSSAGAAAGGAPGGPEDEKPENNNVEQKKLTPEQQRAIRSLERQIRIHEEKIAEFQKNPTIRPGMENQPRSVIEAQWEARIRHLEREIKAFQQNIDKIKN